MTGSGTPRLIVFSQARWSRKSGGRIALRGRRPQERTRTTAAGHMRTRLQITARHARARPTVCLCLHPFPPARQLGAEPDGRRLRSNAWDSLCTAMSRSKLSRLIFDVAKSRISSQDAMGARRIFATGALRIEARRARQILFDQSSVTVGAVSTERASGRCPCRARLPCVQLVASRFGVSNAPLAQVRCWFNTCTCAIRARFGCDSAVVRLRFNRI